MRIRVIALLVGVLVLSYGISATFDINFVALFAGIFVFLKSFKLTFIVQWIGRFVLIQLPKRLMTTAVKLYIIDRKRMQQISAWFTRQQLHWRKHYKLRLVVLGSLGLVIAIISAWWIGVWLLVLYEVEVLLEILWRKVWPTLSETLFVKSVSTCYQGLKKTRLGRFIIRIDTFLENHFRKKMEQTGTTHKKNAKKLIEEVLTYQLRMRSLPPPLKEAGHRHLNCQSFRKKK